MPALVPVIIAREGIGVSLADPDGAYWQVEGSLVEVIVIGPMHYTPGMYQRAVGEALGHDYRVTKAEFMMNDDPALNVATLQRGFFRMEFAPIEVVKAVAA